MGDPESIALSERRREPSFTYMLCSATNDFSNPASSWRVLRNVAEALRLQSHLLEAESLYFRALQSAVVFHGDESAAVGLLLLDLADLYGQTGQVNESERMFGRAVTILRRLASLKPSLIESAPSQ